ncbi:protein angel homolog 2-like [Schistocerca gregaria]|uniref:protein angel homolog 2-like n=1 Tax=Schistocerca gregaria TaxID=7010 RepID=UPI00211EC926|nr:protein angel homolog 2-like [Schistocerca gregaria]
MGSTEANTETNCEFVSEKRENEPLQNETETVTSRQELHESKLTDVQQAENTNKQNGEDSEKHVKQSETTAGRKDSIATNTNSVANATTFERAWEFTGYLNRANPCSGKVLFSIMSYNILSQRTLENNPEVLHSFNPQSVMWEFRGPKLAKEIYDLNADIMCFQEMEIDSMDMLNYMNDLGYLGIMKPRTPMDMDGLTIYYRPKLFRLVEYISADYVDPLVGIVNCGLIVKLALVTSSDVERYLVVANAHLPPGNESSKTKILQVELLLSEVERFAGACPVLVAGDLQVEPFSPLYRLLTMGLHPRDQSPRQQRRTAPRCSTLPGPVAAVREPALLAPQPPPARSWEVTRLVRPVREQRHELLLRSAYRHGRPGSDGAEVSHLPAAGRACCPDFILYSAAAGAGSLELVARYSLPTRRHAALLAPLPSHRHPSDHLPLVANFAVEL